MNDGRKQAEDTFQESFSLLYTVIHATKDAMIAITEEGLIAVFNPAAEEMFGRTREEMLGQPLDSLMPEEYRDRHREYVKSYFATGQPCGALGHVLELPGLRRDGTVFPMEISLSPGQYGRTKRKQFVIAIARDITERRRTEEEQRARLERVRGQQAAIVKLATHDAVVAGDLEEAARVITEVAGETMEVERVGVWLLSEDHRQLRCTDLFERSHKAHSAGTVLETDDYPRYFEALKAGRGINSTDARTDPRTSEFTDRYLVPLAISSMLDAPIRLRGQVIGVVCHEHVGPCRIWQTDEVAFAGEVADQVAQVLMNRERKQAEEALRESEERYRALAEFASDCIYWRSPDGETLYISPACVELTGYTPDEFQASPDLFDTLVHPDDRHRWKNHDHVALANGAPQALEFRIVTKHGLTRWISHLCRPVYDDAGTFLGVRGSNRDITDRKQVEEDLQESEERFRQVAENAQEWIWEVDAKGLYTYASPVVSQILGYEPEELVGNKHFYDLFHPEDREELKKAASEVFGKKESFREFINRNIDRDGNTIWLSTSGVPVLDAEGNLVGYRGADTNITERKRAEQELAAYRDHLEELVEQRSRELEKSREQLRRAERLASVGTLGAGIAHEMNNPLGLILMNAQRGLEGIDDRSTVETSLLSIKDNVKRCSRIVKSVLQFSREQPSDTSPLDLNEIIRDSEAFTREYAKRQAVRMQVDLSTDLPLVIGHKTELEQVFVNLIYNAVQASSPGQTVALRSVKTRGGARIVVRDEGEGMSDVDKQHAFDPFYTTRQQLGGIGLGLSVSHSIVTAVGGTIQIESEAGKGTTVAVEFPAHAPAENRG